MIQFSQDHKPSPLLEGLDVQEKEIAKEVKTKEPTHYLATQFSWTLTLSG